MDQGFGSSTHTSAEAAGRAAETSESFQGAFMPQPRARARAALLCAALTLASLPTVAEGAVLRGTKGADRIVGTDDADTILARGGADRLDGRGGADRINGGAGRDRIWA